MKEETFKKYLEPVLLLVSIAATAFVGLFLLLNAKLINPNPIVPFCSMGFYPWNCVNDDDVECIRGTQKRSLAMFGYAIFFHVLLALVILTSTMFLIILAFYKSEHKLKNRPHRRTSLVKSWSPSPVSTQRKEQEDSYREESEHTLSRIITRQALMYIGAFLLTWIFTILSILKYKGQNEFIEVLRMIFQPLQGFFSMAIFVYHKVSNIRRADEDENISGALRIIFTSPSMVPEVIVSRIAIVAQTHYLKIFENILGGMVNVGTEEYSDVCSAMDTSNRVMRTDEVSDVPSMNDYSYMNSVSMSQKSVSSSEAPAVAEVDSDSHHRDLEEALGGDDLSQPCR